MAASTSQSVRSFFGPQVLKSVNEAELRWSLFVAQHNLSFQTSDHATKLFKAMFPDSDIAKKFACGHTKTTAIITEVLAPHNVKFTTENMSNNPFSMSPMIAQISLASFLSECLTTMWEMFVQGSWICLWSILALHKIFSRPFQIL